MAANNNIEEKLKGKSPIAREAYYALRGALRRLLNDECSEEELIRTMISLDRSAAGYFREEDFVNVDEAAKLLGFGTNRQRTINTLRNEGVRNHTFNNQHIGYKREEVLQVKSMLEK